MPHVIYVEDKKVGEAHDLHDALRFIDTNDDLWKELLQTGNDIYCEAPDGKVYRYHSEVQGASYWVHEGKCPECGLKYKIARLPDGMGFGPVCAGGGIGGN